MLPTHATSLRILVVDDNPTHCDGLCKMLEHFGFATIQAQTGHHAIEKTLQLRPDVILLDINLPDVNGFDVCRTLKNEDQTRSIPIIFHSATEPTAWAKAQAEIVGGMAFLTYPISIDHLVTVVKGSVRRASKPS